MTTTHTRTRAARATALVAVAATSLGTVGLLPAEAAPSDRADARAQRVERPPASGRYNVKTPTSTGYGGAVTSVDPEASRVGLQVLRRGGNAVDAAVATAAALGVTEPYSAGIGGGGYFVHYDARTGRVSTLDGRETAPKRIPDDAFVDPATGQTYDFPDLVSSGLSVGTPGTLATWETALRRWGTRGLGAALRPAARLAERGFVVDRTFRSQTADNEERFRQFPATGRLFLPGGQLPRVGSVLRNRDLARTYREIARRGTGSFYDGALAREIAAVVADPPTVTDPDLPAPAGYLRARDLADYRVVPQAPTRVRYRGYEVVGMAPSSSGGSTVGEALNILEGSNLASLPTTQFLHRYLEASALAFADRAEQVGDDAFVDVPLDDLLSDDFGAERACEIDPEQAATKPVGAGDVDDYDGRCDTAQRTGSEAPDTENLDTTNLTVVDRRGNVVEYTLTIEQTGGSGITVPGRGFLLNNELTDFTLAYDADDPNRIQPGKRPRSSMSPTMVLRGGKPVLALGSPGGSTIITTVLQVLLNRLDRDMTIAEALAAPRASQRNTATVSSEPAFLAQHEAALEALGHDLVPAGDALTSAAEIGAATAVEIGPRGRLTAVSEPVRRGGGSALVVRPRR
ncbi:gamma-glutamyltransferase [Nocardioides marmoraquaticus]